ncbi:hypothetical protein L6164_012606 [Bauhinia variegata]|uniref:Uncharacterized protein n=1 Tax=Bauhinia variegata TaxID=167791 RepID=A0ACB9PFS5_BAUVA|nr:hypothetical protein L6164_012606 [Bauhinia variegata]
MDSQIKVPSFSIEPKVPISIGYSTSVDAASMMDRTGINPGDHLASLMHPPKRHKLIPYAHLPSSENPETVSLKPKTASFPDGITCRGLLERAVSEGSDPTNSVVNCKTPGLPHEKHLMKKDFPAPLATKMYYSQRNNRLRAALSQLYYQESSKELCTELAGPNLSNEKIAVFQDLSQGDACEQNVDELNKKKSYGRTSTTTIGLTKRSSLLRPYSFTSKTGNPLGTIQQPNEKVPVA